MQLITRERVDILHPSHTVYSMQRRPNLAELVASRVREEVVDGVLEAGTRINEVQLAEALGVSRTPLREALSQLVSEGFLAVEPRRGHFVRPLEASEVPDLYAMRALLDPTALRWAGVPPGARLDALTTLNERMRASTEPRAIIELDDRWHLELLSHCTNPFLLEEIRRFMSLTLRYELAYFGHVGGQGVAFDEHDAILAALRDHDLEGACRALAQNLSSAVTPLVEWLSA